jgi:hypothetical protein
MKLVEDGFLLFSRNSPARVEDCQVQGLIADAASDEYATSGGVPDGIADEVLRNPLYHDRVAVDMVTSPTDFEPNALQLGQGGKLLFDARKHIANAEDAQVGYRFVGIQAGNVEQ